MRRSRKQVIDALVEIRDANDGLLRAEDVVAAAEPDGSPLHSYFTWDDSVAAHQHRLWQARRLIQVTVTYLPQTKRKMRVFVSLSADRHRTGGGYRATAVVLSRAGTRQQLIEDALADMERFRTRYEGLQELAEVFTALARAEKRMLIELGYIEQAG